MEEATVTIPKIETAKPANIVPTETRPIQPRIYAGLERLDSIKEQEDFLEGALQNVRDPSRRRDYETRLTAMRLEREELLKKYDIAALLEQEKAERLKKDNEALDIRDGKGVARVVAYYLADQLPAGEDESARRSLPPGN